MSDIEFDYEYLGQRALRQVVIDVLTVTADLGEAPGDHHFYIEFLTDAAGVVMPDHLKAAYPERMTIVLQHQFENLRIDDEGFSVTLWFRGRQADLAVPFDAMTSFADPSAEFGLRFEPELSAEAEEKSISMAVSAKRAVSKAAAREAEAEQDDAGHDVGADVVNLDAFRKK
ncbi:MAG: ClpXP protease specificity-enhancing factor SspB [Pseudomonadota bacterium]